MGSFSDVSVHIAEAYSVDLGLGDLLTDFLVGRGVVIPSVDDGKDGTAVFTKNVVSFVFG